MYMSCLEQNLQKCFVSYVEPGADMPNCSSVQNRDPLKVSTVNHARIKSVLVQAVLV